MGFLPSIQALLHAGGAPLLALAGGAHEQHQVELSYLWLIPFFPLLGSALNATLGKRLQDRFGKSANHGIAIGAMVLSTAVAWVAFARLLATPVEDRFLHDLCWNMFTVGSLRVDLAFGLDPLSTMMTLIVTNVATLIHVFSVGYMSDEPAYWRFFCELNLFVFSMLLLVMGDNFVLMFFGWEGVGLCSYLLISFWYTDVEKAKAGMKAFVVNRFGDFAFVTGLFALLWGLGGAWGPASRSELGVRDDYQPSMAFQPFHDGGNAEESLAQTPHVAGLAVGPTINFRELQAEVLEPATGVLGHLKSTTIFGFPLIAFICILFFIGATGKSAQIPLYVWLPDAMAGPTPVSALIHAATMVTAGVYMVTRLNFLFSQSAAAMTVIACTGALTALFAASIGLFQVDIKKVLAYSTVSQLGYMFLGVGVGAYWAGCYHLLTHAFFKACLFLGSGSVILACHHEQDMRKMGGLKEYTPITRWTYALACIAISGFPVMSGFYSKDEILWKTFTTENLVAPWIGPVLWAIGLVAAGGTSFYMWRSYYLTFWSGKYRGVGGHGGGGHAVALATHSLGAAHAGTFGADVALASSLTSTAHGHGGAEEESDPPHGNADPHGAHDPHHGGAPHESPAVMTYVLIALAAAAGLASFLGLPKAWMGQDPILEKFLEPVLAGSNARLHFTEYGTGLESLFMLLSVGVATAGWLFARWMYVTGENPLPERMLELFPGVHRVIFNKYYVDELYRGTVVRAAMVLKDLFYWFDRVVIDGAVTVAAWVVRFVANVDGAIDKYLVDGAVNLVANLLLAMGRRLRRVQSGRIENYLMGALAGALVVVAVNYLVH
ncbi:MAG: NADH-quinone oxidoreductase subunit L [Deltaproteobacteria bacterium]